MKKILFVLLLSIIFIIPNAIAETKPNGVCLKYEIPECIQYQYCTSKTNTGCSAYEICTRTNDKYICINPDRNRNEIIYRSKEFLDSQIINIYKPTYTTPDVERYRKLPMNDVIYPDPARSRYEHINQELVPKNYYQPNTTGNGPIYTPIPRHNEQVDIKKPYNQLDRVKRMNIYGTYFVY